MLLVKMCLLLVTSLCIIAAVLSSEYSVVLFLRMRRLSAPFLDTRTWVQNIRRTEKVFLIRLTCHPTTTQIDPQRTGQPLPYVQCRYSRTINTINTRTIAVVVFCTCMVYAHPHFVCRPALHSSPTKCTTPPLVSATRIHRRLPYICSTVEGEAIAHRTINQSINVYDVCAYSVSVKIGNQKT